MEDARHECQPAEGRALRDPIPCNSCLLTGPRRPGHPFHRRRRLRDGDVVLVQEAPVPPQGAPRGDEEGKPLDGDQFHVLPRLQPGARRLCRDGPEPGEHRANPAAQPDHRRYPRHRQRDAGRAARGPMSLAQVHTARGRGSILAQMAQAYLTGDNFGDLWLLPLAGQRRRPRRHRDCDVRRDPRPHPARSTSMSAASMVQAAVDPGDSRATSRPPSSRPARPIPTWP